MLSRCSESQTLCRLCHIYLQSQLWRTTLCSLGSADSVPSHRCVVPLFTTFRSSQSISVAQNFRGLTTAQTIKRLPTMRETRVQSLGREDPLEKAMATPLQYSCLENPRDGEAWQAAVHGVAKSRTRGSNFTFTFNAPRKKT